MGQAPSATRAAAASPGTKVQTVLHKPAAGTVRDVLLVFTSAPQAAGD